jgi:hypothetical protein
MIPTYFLYCIILMISTKIVSLNEEEEKFFECIVRSQKLENQYIFNPTRTWNHSSRVNQNVFLYNLEKLDLNDITWKFIQFDDVHKGCFFLKSQKYNEYLCTNRYQKVFTTDKANKYMVNNNLNECKWRFEGIKSEFYLNTFKIYNVFYNKILYFERVSNYSINNGLIKRKLLIDNKEIESDYQEESKWIVDCYDDDFQNLI